MGLSISKNVVAKSTLYEQIADSLEAMILESNEDSFKLPTENDMALQFGVSRTIIREAMKILRERGLIVSKVGEGAYTTRPDSEYLSRVIFRIIKSNHLSDSDITEVRLVLESESARLAAYNSTPEFIAALKKNLEEMKSAETIELRVQKDIEFHTMIARQSKNDLLVIFVESINGILSKYITKRLILRPEGKEDGNRWHSKLVNLFETANPIEIEDAMRQHLYDSFKQLELIEK